jgi:hypothetical protein
MPSVCKDGPRVLANLLVKVTGDKLTTLGINQAKHRVILPVKHWADYALEYMIQQDTVAAQ